jgi:hypothetical protein
MKYTNIMFIALALCMVLAVAPVTAVWENGNWVESSNAVHDAQTGVDSKYVATSAFGDAPTVGILRGSIRSGYSTLTPKVGIRNDLAGENGTFTYFPILADGKFGDLNGNVDIELIPGKYTLYIPDGNGGQPEYSHATIVAGVISYPEKELLGHAVSAYSRGNPLDAGINAYLGCGDIELQWIKIVQTGSHYVEPTTRNVRTYDKIIDQQYVPEVPGIPAVTHEVQVCVPGTPAVPAVTHQDYEAGHVHAKKVNGNSQHDFEHDGDKYQITGNHNDNAYIVSSHTNVRHANMVTIIDVPAIPAGQPVCHMETVIDVPAIPAIPAIPETHHHAWVTHVVDVPGYTVKEYGLELFVEVDSAHVQITNPNTDPVSVEYKFDVNYWVDDNPWDNRAFPEDMSPRSVTYVGEIATTNMGVHTFHVTLHPDIDLAAELNPSMTPYINNDVVTATAWA